MSIGLLTSRLAEIPNKSDAFPKTHPSGPKSGPRLLTCNSCSPTSAVINCSALKGLQCRQFEFSLKILERVRFFFSSLYFDLGVLKLDCLLAETL